MKLDHHKELTPVLYNSAGLKILTIPDLPKKSLLFNMHWHERMEFILITSGELILRVNNQEFVLKQNQLAIIPPGMLHLGMTDEMDVSYQTIMFELERYCTSLPATESLLRPIIAKQVTFVPWTDHCKILEIVKEILAKDDPNDKTTALLKIGKIYELFFYLYEYCVVEEKSENQYNHQFREILEYVNKHFAEAITTSNLSAQFGYSEEHFCRKFKEFTGLKPMVYIRILRMEKARKLLESPQYTCDKIAIKCGFSNANYFTRSFKQYFGMTPREYRQNLHLGTTDKI